MNPIFISLSPNAFVQDVRLAFRLLFSPWSWKKGRQAEWLEKEFADYLSGVEAISFESGRSSWYEILKALDIKAGDEVLVQSFSCVVVPNSILWTGAKPVYVDIDPKTLNMDLGDLEKKINIRSKVILVQHTFGLPQDMNRIIQIANKYNLQVVEDCAHALGAELKNNKGEWQKVGTFGEAAFFSFGRDKVISSVHGGMAVSRHENLAKRLRKQQQALKYPSFGWIFQQLMHPVWMFMVKELYYIGSIGKVLLVLLQKMGLMSKAVQPIEKKGARPKVHPRRLANAQAELARAQFARLDEFNASRRSVAARYRAELQLDGAEHLLESENTRPIYMRYNLLTRQARQLIQEARSQAMLLGNWYSPAMAPSGVDCRAIFYDPDTCPIAEDASAKVVNLPTYPLMKEEDVDRVIELVRDVLQKEDL